MKKLLIAIIISVCNPVFAGQNCDKGSMPIKSIEDSLNFTGSVIDKLDRLDPNGNKVFLLGRVGQDLSKYNQKYSHGAYAYKENGHWLVTHELNSCNSNQSSIFQDGLANFYLDDLFKFETVLITFKEPYNSQLKAILKNQSQYTKMHEHTYNMVAYPYSTKYQNSNGWLLETMMLAVGNVERKTIQNRQDAQNLLTELSYTPDVMNIDMATRLGGRLTKANIAFDDQPFNERMAGKIQVVTFDGLIPFFKQKALIEQIVEMSGIE